MKVKEKLIRPKGHWQHDRFGISKHWHAHRRTYHQRSLRWYRVCSSLFFYLLVVN